MPDSGHVLRSCAGSQAAEILVEHHVEDPVQTVLDMPMASHGEQFAPFRLVLPLRSTSASTMAMAPSPGNRGSPGTAVRW